MTDVERTPAAPSSTSIRWLLPVSLVATACVIVACAWWLTGPAPKPVDAGISKEPPPIALPSDVPNTSPLARAAADLATGDLERARRGFTDVVADDPESQAGQVGLVMSGWRRVGSESVERDLQQLQREYPDSAYVGAHLALVQSLRGDARSANATLRDARAAGWKAADPTSLRMASIADDLLHTSAFRGYVPVLVSPAEVPVGDRAPLRALLDDVGRGDRAAAARRADRLGSSQVPMVRIAAAAAAFDKDQPDATVAVVAAIVRDALAAGDDAAAARGRLVGALALAWGGEDRAAACEQLRAIGRTSSVDAATRRLAQPIVRELCPGDAAP